MNSLSQLKLLFIINPHSGNNKIDSKKVIIQYLQKFNHILEWIILDEHIDKVIIKKKVVEFQPDRVVAVGGDGTIKLAAEFLLHTDICLGLIPAGSANGFAKELHIPLNVNKALDIIITGHTKTIHIVRINGQTCIHLGDIGFNAFVIKKFETDAHRGMFGYVKAAWKVLWLQPKMTVILKVDEKELNIKAAMIVIANASKYGSGALINPDGKLDDEKFEVVVVKKVSILEIFKMMFTHTPFDPSKTQVYQVKNVAIQSKRKAHFQVDGEYLGRVNNINATILPAALHVVVPGNTVE